MQQAVNHHVGVAADGAGEVGVVLKGQTVVTNVLGRVDGLGHGAQCQHLNQILLAFALHLLQYSVHGIVYLLVLLGHGLIAKAADELGKLVVPLLRWLVVNTIDKGLGRTLPACGVYLVLANVLGHAPIGQEHKLLNQHVALFGHLEVDAQRLAVLVNLKTGFGSLETYGTCGKTTFA